METETVSYWQFSLGELLDTVFPEEDVGGEGGTRNETR